jgi:predicted Zn-dependent protease
LARTAAGVGGFVAAVATGSGYVGSQISQVASIWAQTGLSGYGREDELQADSLGAEYIRDAGYDATAMINVVTVLKNQEDFSRQINNGAGGYHGLFASHPRNDTRLQEAIASVAALGDGAASEIDNTEFREHINGLIVGASSASQTAETRNRYYQQLLRYTVVFPDDWQIAETTTTVTAAQPGIGDLRIETQRLQENISPRDFIRDSLGIANLQKSEPLDQYRLLGHTGLAQTTNGTMERVAVIYYGPRVFVFRGQILDSNTTDDIDQMLLSSVRTFRAIQQGEVVGGTEPRLKYVQASEFFDFAVVAKESRIANYPEETLRLLNGYYPTGKPKAGEWVKLVE